MLLDDVGPHRLEGAIADVQGHLRPAHASMLESIEQRRREMQSRRGRSHRSTAAGIDRLVPLAVRPAVVALDVRRQRHVSDGVHDLRDGATVRRPHTNCPATERVLREDFNVEPRWRFPKTGASARLHLLPRMHQHIPPLVVDLAQQQALDLSATGLTRPSRRAGTTRELLTTSKSEGASRSGRSAAARSVHVPVVRSTTSRRDAPRCAEGCCAIWWSGRGKSKSERRTERS